MRISSLILRTLALLALLVLATGVDGQDALHTKFGNFLFNAANGWNPVEKEDAMLLVAPAPRPGTATHIVLAAGDLDGNLQESFNEFLTVAKIPTDPPQSSQDTSGQLPPGKLQGVYVCTGGADGRPTNKQYIFYPDGLMVYGIPKEGMLGFDFDHYRSESNRARNWVGRYQLDGDKVRIVWQNQFGDPARPVLIKINETSAHPAWDAGWDTFIPMCRCTGKTFSGKYHWGAPAADQYLQFFADGTFIDHRVTDQLIVPSPFYSRPRIQRGTYSIQSQTIIFNFADGHRGMRTFVAPKAQENQPMFDWIGLGWQQLFEESYPAKLAR